MTAGFVPWPDEFARYYRERGYWRDRTLGALLDDGARRWPSRTAVVDGARRWSYAELNSRATRLACGLRARGIGHGDRVLVHLPNVAEFLSLTFALFRIGAVPVLALLPHRRTEIVHLARLATPVAYVVASELRNLAYAVPEIEHVFVVGDPGEFTAIEDVAAEGEPGEGPGPDDIAVLLLSGGTTGLPKLVPRTHNDYDYNIRASAKLCGFNGDTRYLAVLPMAHNFPLACPGVLGTLSTGGTVVLGAGADPGAVFPLIKAERVTATALVPPLVLVWLDAAEEPEESTVDLSSLGLLQVGGSRLKAEAARRVTPLLGCALQQVYGMAEGLLNFTRFGDPDAIVNDTQGRPLCADDEVRVVTDGEEPVPPGDVGELLVRGPYTIRGYYRAAEHNAGAFTSDGYYRTGDLVRRLPSGELVVEGRVNDVINRGGDKIPVEEVENLLMAHPAVHDVAVVGIPDDVLGERSCAYVVARGTPPTRKDLIAHLTELGVAAFKQPDRVRFVRSFPRNGLGKVDRKALSTLEIRS
ncbi:2,3-dihydroxybenzoate-AMP ligase [Amycolatopsis lurida]|uniref:Triostin synthetase I n=1 Tax=Amycolatopsis lurida NRRL 2430 TaxID=1460371 RepID=A0A2P2FFT6_AMYLU|nr:AMP-binding protein [Amycolatopsis lurida]KFU75586.1 Triostin synthetase I [Amycolatopsis lurida NRRL 2430]SEE29113.1 2,3-dihydroxybenzoate-AMP ligase [Amycolatopsis lurida]